MTEGQTTAQTELEAARKAFVSASRKFTSTPSKVRQDALTEASDKYRDAYIESLKQS